MNGKNYKLKRLAIIRYGQKRLDMRFTKNLSTRLNHELKIIEETGTEDFFLDCIKQGDEARKQGDYYVNGTANCSFLFYCTNTTAVNPIICKLPFERFCNPLLAGDPYFEIVFAPKRILAEEDLDFEKLLIQLAFENGHLSEDVFDRKHTFPAIHCYRFAEEVLQETRYTLVWQEQLIELLYRIGGFTYTEADYFRRDMAKKHMKKIYGEVRNRFLKHATHVGYDWKWASDFFHYLVTSSDYLPCKAYYAALAVHTSFQDSPKSE